MKTKLIIYAVLIIAVLIFWQYGKYKARELNELQQVQQYKEAYFEKKLLESGQTIFQQDQVILSQKQAIKQGIITKNELKENNIKQLQSIVRLKEQLNIAISAEYDSIQYIVLYDTIKQDSFECMTLPAGFKYKSEWVRLHGTMYFDSVRFDYIQLRSEPQITIGYQKTGFLRREAVVIYQNKNPFMYVTEMNNVVIEDNKPFWRKGWFYGLVGGVGVLIGIGL